MEYIKCTKCGAEIDIEDLDGVMDYMGSMEYVCEDCRKEWFTESNLNYMMRIKMDYEYKLSEEVESIENVVVNVKDELEEY